MRKVISTVVVKLRKMQKPVERVYLLQHKSKPKKMFSIYTNLFLHQNISCLHTQRRHIHSTFQFSASCLFSFRYKLRERESMRDSFCLVARHLVFSGTSCCWRKQNDSTSNTLASHSSATSRAR